MPSVPREGPQSGRAREGRGGSGDGAGEVAVTPTQTGLPAARSSNGSNGGGRVSLQVWWDAMP